jgi:hypothetical protein
VATEADATVERLLQKKYTVIEELLEAVFYMRSAPRLHAVDRDGAVVNI